MLATLAVFRYKVSMNLQNIRNDLATLLSQQGLSQYEFAARNGLSYSSVNKFLNDPDPNPRFSSLQALTEAMQRERERAKQ